ncbi:MAG: carbohydrate ABC transporter permease [Spirochaetaceae bacterium]|nr:MAG: carbohydrate ABC transporter permease [Spirochaetaceae bacterium]
MRRTNAYKSIGIFILVVIALSLSFYPIYWVIQLSMKSHVEAFKFPPSWIFKPSFSNYQRLFAGTAFPKRLLNSLIVATLSTLFALAVGTPAAYVFSRKKFKHKNLLLLLVLTSRMIPPVVFIVPYFMVYINIGLIDTRLGLILIYVTFSLGLVVWSMWTFFDEIPTELDEAAEVDGASILQTIWKVILPVAIAGLASTGILCFIMAWNDFIFALVLTRTNAVTAPVEITKAMAYEAEDIGLMTSGSLAISFPALLFAIIVRKYLRKGVLGGAVKE